MIKKVIRYILTLVIILTQSIPLYILLNLSFKSSMDTSSKWCPPRYIYFLNIKNVWKEANLHTALTNNIIITLFTLLLIITIGSFAAYPLARNKTKFNKFIYSFCVACMIIPPLSILVPLYKFMVKIKWINTFLGIIVLHTTFSLPLTIFLYTGFINTIPKEIEEAATLDGCNKFQIFSKIIFPLLKPVTTTISILIGVKVWNDYQFSLFFLDNPKVQTITIKLAQFVSDNHSNINYVAAGCFIGIIPIVILFIFLQKYFTKGIENTSLNK